jgi:regulatory protein
MPKITAITQQKKNANRWSIFVDGEFFLGCTEEFLTSTNLHEGDEVPSSQLDKLMTDATGCDIRQKALGYLSRRARSIAEMKKYLTQKGFSEDLVTETIDWLAGKKYLNDRQFADDWVKMRLRLAPRGKQGLLMELFQKGIDRSIANEAIAENLETEGESEVAYQTIIQRKNRWKGAEWLDIERRIYNFLSYRGFSGEAIVAAVRRYREEWKQAGEGAGLR